MPKASKTAPESMNIARFSARNGTVHLPLARVGIAVGLVLFEDPVDEDVRQHAAAEAAQLAPAQHAVPQATYRTYRTYGTYRSLWALR